MSDLRDLVWEEEGFIINKNDLDNDLEADETFFEGKTLEEAIKGCYKKEKVWMHKYFEEMFFYEEEACLEDAIDRAEDGTERSILERRLEELDSIAKSPKNTKKGTGGEGE